MTHDGELVNIKLRVTGSIRNQDAVPSISKFAKMTLSESRQSCLSSVENSPENPLGVIVFMDCHPEKARDPDKEYSTYYVSRWAQILRNGHNSISLGDDGDTPFIGLGRLFIDKSAPAIVEAQANIESLNRTRIKGWEDQILSNEIIANDYTRYGFYLHGYLTSQEVIINQDDRNEAIGFMSQSIDVSSRNSNNGFLFRAQTEEGIIIKEVNSEIFPMYLMDKNRFQNALELFDFFVKSNPEVDALGKIQYRIMPILRFAGKKIYKDSIRSHAEYQALEETYFIDGEPQVFDLCAKIDRLSNRERLLNKIILTGPSVGSPLLLNGLSDQPLSVRAFIHDDETSQGAESSAVMPLCFSSEIGSLGSIQVSNWYETTIVNKIDVEKMREDIKRKNKDFMESGLGAPARNKDIELSLPVVTGWATQQKEVATVQPQAGLSSMEVNTMEDCGTLVAPDLEDAEDRHELPALVNSGSAVLDNTVHDIPSGKNELDDMFGGDEIDAQLADEDDLFNTGDFEEDDSSSDSEDTSPSVFGSVGISFDSLSTNTIVKTISAKEGEATPIATAEQPNQDSISYFDEPDQAAAQVIDPIGAAANDLAASIEVALSEEDQEKSTGSHDEELPDQGNHVNNIIEVSGISKDLTNEHNLPDLLEAELDKEDSDFTPDDDKEIDPWLDDEILEENLNEAPDAYSDVTELDSPTTSPVDDLSEVQKNANSLMSSLSADQDSAAIEPRREKPKKGGLAKFMKKRKKD